jgi:hypothetical protein
MVGSSSTGGVASRYLGGSSSAGGGAGGIGILAPISGHMPASIRYNNPGAQWPRSGDTKFGAIGYGRLADGNLIERFSDPSQGAAANMALFASHYVGMRLGAAGAKWTGGHGFGVPGYNPNMIVTREMMNDPNFVIPFFKAIAGREAGRPSPLNDEQWMRGFQIFQHGGIGASAVPPPKSPEVHIHTKTILDGRVISENSMKHMANGGEKAASGGRMYDRSYTRPITI